MGTTVTLDGLDLTSTDEFGCSWRTLAPIDGWDGSPATTLGLTQKPRQAGAWRGPTPQLAARHVVLAGLVQAPSAAALEAALDRLNAAAAVADPVALQVTRGDTPRSALVYRDGEVVPTEVTDTVAQWSVALTAPDPRKYGPTQVVSTGLPAASGGLTWPVTWPIEWTGTTSGTLSIDNVGNTAAPLTMRIDGPCVGPRIRHVSSGRELTLASSYTIAAGSYLDIDMENRTVLEGGTASRNGWITDRGWFLLDKGANDLIFSAQSYDPSALLTVTFAPAYQ